MGHILPGTEDAYYDRTKVDFHRRQYARLDFSRGEMLTRAVDKLITFDELERHLEEGWLFVAKISDDRTIVRRTR